MKNITQLILDQKVNHHPPCGNVLFHFHKAPEKTGSTERAVHLANCISQINPDSVGGTDKRWKPVCPHLAVLAFTNDLMSKIILVTQREGQIPTPIPTATSLSSCQHDWDNYDNQYLGKELG